MQSLESMAIIAVVNMLSQEKAAQLQLYSKGGGLDWQQPQADSKPGCLRA